MCDLDNFLLRRKKRGHYEIFFVVLLLLDVFLNKPTCLYVYAVYVDNFPFFKFYIRVEL